MTTIAIFGSRDRKLEDLLRAAGMHGVPMDAAALLSLGSGGGGTAPDLLLIDTRAGGGLPPTLAALKRQQPALGVIVLAATLDPALLLEGMRAGVGEVVPEPIDQAALESAIARVIGQRQPNAGVGQVFGFIGAKGGVGTTTLAVNVATALGRLSRGGQTLLIDMHQAGGDAAVFAGVEPRFSLLDALDNTHRLDRMYLSGLVAQVSPELDLLASSDRAFAGQADPVKIRSVLEFVMGLYRYVVLDLPRSDSVVLDALDRVTTIFVVANQELATVKNATRIVATLRQRYGRDRIKIVLSRSDRQADIGLSDIERAIGGPIADTIPSDYRSALQALNRGRPVVLDEDNDLSESFRRFAQRLAGQEGESRPAPTRGGLFGRLTQARRA